MPPKDKSKKNLKAIKTESDSDDSVDSKGNIRNLVDYGYTSDESDVYYREKRIPRKAAIIARNKINKIIQKEYEINEHEKNQNAIKEVKEVKEAKEVKEVKESKKKTKQLTPSKRKYPFKKINQSPSKSPSPIESPYNSPTESSCESSSEDSVSSDESPVSEVEENKGLGSIILSFTGNTGNTGTIKTTKYNMKKESDIVKKFVKLLTEPVETNTIDAQIDQFKALHDDKQKELIVALENRTSSTDSGVNLMLKILTLKLPPDVQAMVLGKYNSLQNLDTSTNEYFKLRAWLDKVVSIPFGIYKDIPVNINDGPDKCLEFMKCSKKFLDDAIYGQEDSKLQIMQFISTKITNPSHRGLSLLLVGAPGIGKTALIKNGIAKALDWPFQFISLGGDSDASTYTGHQLVYESSHCGKIVNSLIASKSMSTILMFDEIDKLSQTAKGEEVMNLLIHLTDPVQNGDFEDKYLAGVPIDLSKVMFIFSANDISKIDKILLDRMMVINLNGYDLKQKTVIAEQYLLPIAINDVNLYERISISKDILTYIIEEFSGDEKGVRQLKRCIEQVTQKINMLRIYNSTELPFHIKDFSLPFIVKKDHIKLFLKKKEKKDIPFGMYT